MPPRPTNHVAVSSSPQDFDLSRNKSLRTLEVTAHTLYLVAETGALTASTSLKHALSTVKSPVPPEVIVFYEDGDLNYWRTPPGPHQLSQTDGIEIDDKHHMVFEALCEMYKVRNFRLVLRANCVGHLREGEVRELERIVAMEQAKGGLDNLSPQPVVTSSPWGSFRSINEAYEHRSYPRQSLALVTLPRGPYSESYSDHPRYYSGLSRKSEEYIRYNKKLLWDLGKVYCY